MEIAPPPAKSSNVYNGGGIQRVDDVKNLCPCVARHLWPFYLTAFIRQLRLISHLSLRRDPLIIHQPTPRIGDADRVNLTFLV